MDPVSLAMVVLGVGLVLVGARLHGLAVISPGLAAGAAAGLYLPLEPTMRLVAGVLIAGVGAVVCRMLEQAAVRSFGAMLAGGLTALVLPLITPEPPVWAPAVGAAVGMLLFPSAFRMLLIPLTATAGSLLVAFALGQQEQVLIIGAGAVVGTLVQLGLRREPSEDED